MSESLVGQLAQKSTRRLNSQSTWYTRIETHCATPAPLFNSTWHTTHVHYAFILFVFSSSWPPRMERESSILLFSWNVWPLKALRMILKERSGFSDEICSFIYLFKIQFMAHRRWGMKSRTHCNKTWLITGRRRIHKISPIRRPNDKKWW